MKPQRQLLGRVQKAPKNNDLILTGLNSARIMARAWAETVDDRKRLQAAWAFIKASIDEYVHQLSQNSGSRISVSSPVIALTYELDPHVVELARTVGQEASKLPMIEACFQLSAAYTVLVPSRLRSSLGMYYTPPSLSEYFLEIVSSTGINWKTARVLDPACGGGAFLLPVALKMREFLRDHSPAEQLESLSSRLMGFEIDPFAAWLTQTWLEICLSDLLAVTRRRLPKLVQICDTLEQQPKGKLFDLVIGNPPYGRVSLNPDQRARFSRSLFGHANLYGIFTDVALRWTVKGGIIAFVTPTSFLSGQYFKKLRALLHAEAPPVTIDFINDRKGVFEDVLQETLLATYRRGGDAKVTPIHYLRNLSNCSTVATSSGQFNLPEAPETPWLISRFPENELFIARLSQMKNRLCDWGYKVSTGPLVWNRFKDQLCLQPSSKTFPLIWAEAVSQDGFAHRADKRNHLPYFKVEGAIDEWLKVYVPCVLVQRTTAKEQNRRLIAAELPASFIKKHGAVVVENHVNMVRPANNVTPNVCTAALTALLNSEVVDSAFRCISGSVAVSAFELEALPLPSSEQMQQITRLIKRHAPRGTIEASIRAFYFEREV